MAILAMADLDLAGKRVLIREDLNVPVKNGKIVNDARIRAALPSIQLALQKGATVMLMSHLGRPKEGVPMEQQPDSKLAPVAAHLSQLLGSGLGFRQTMLAMLMSFACFSLITGALSPAAEPKNSVSAGVKSPLDRPCR